MKKYFIYIYLFIIIYKIANNQKFNEEECVICRFISQKIDLILNLDKSCPDNIFIFERYHEKARTWTPNDKALNKYKEIFDTKTSDKIHSNKENNLEDNKTILFNKANDFFHKNYMFKERALLNDNKSDSNILEINPLSKEVEFSYNNVNNSLGLNIIDPYKIRQNKKIVYLGASVASPYLSKKIVRNEHKSNEFLNLHNKNKALNNSTQTFNHTDNSFNKTKLVNDFIDKNVQKIKNETFIKNSTTSQINIINEPSVHITKAIKNNLKKSDIKTNNNLFSTILNPPVVNSRKTKNNFQSFNIIETEDLLIKKEPNNIQDPPLVLSFYEINTIQKPNILQRRGRREKRFSDDQWDCAEKQIKEILLFICKEEMSKSYQYICAIVNLRLSKLIESFLYQDNSIQVCQNIQLCPQNY